MKGRGNERMDDFRADLSAKETIIKFEHPLPLLRHAVRASENDDPSKDPFVLAFPDENARRASWKACEIRLIEQCEAGARMGCSIGASRKCRMPWWKTFLKFGKITSNDVAERDACEEREMQSCLLVSRDKCTEYAKNTCKVAFSGTWVAKLN
eukprot:TRINITY_DN6323_c0_g1_i3.p1 TRINITY_DN6323_c0_g1~~TRINITY_DN6323_c0_g1_i3.p1  ORF type:complete len:153 (+),score=15.50 TRINITY_DN6323_c0_g1_i3:108-566(+)